MARKPKIKHRDTYLHIRVGSRFKDMLKEYAERNGTTVTQVVERGLSPMIGYEKEARQK